MRRSLLFIMLLVASCTDESDAPKCSVNNRLSASHLKDLPPTVLQAFKYKMADSGEYFNKTDNVEYWRMNSPNTRLICGYAINNRYIVEQENGGIGYFIRKIIFRKDDSGYKYDFQNIGFDAKDISNENCHCGGHPAKI